MSRDIITTQELCLVLFFKSYLLLLNIFLVFCEYSYRIQVAIDGRSYLILGDATSLLIPLGYKILNSDQYIKKVYTNRGLR